MRMAVSIVVLVFLFGVGAGLADEGWNRVTLDEGEEGWAGGYSSLEFDSQGYPHISYLEWLEHYPYDGVFVLKYIRWTGEEWVEELRYTGEYGVGVWSNLELDSNDLPHIAYAVLTDDPYNWHLGYSYYDGAQWHHEVVDDREVMGGPLSLKLDSQGHPHIAYTEYYGGLWYAYHDGEGWSYQHLDEHPNMYVAYPSMDLDRNDYPHISYCCQSSDSGHLLYVYWDGSRWVYEGVGPTCWTDNTSLELDSSDHPHIAFSNNAGSPGLYFYLRYAHYDGSGWEYETVDDDGLTGQHISLALDSRDNPSISYQCDCPSQQEVLRYARRTPYGWETEVVDDTTPDTGRNTCLKMDADDNPHITYMDHVSVDLRYAWYGELTGLEDAEFTALAGGDGVELAWLVEDASDVAGYNIYRRPYFGEGESAWLKLNSAPLPGGSAGRWLDRDVEAGVRYEYRLEALRDTGAVEVGRAEAEVPPGYGGGPHLYAAYPCPSRGSAVIEFDLPDGGEAVLEVYDLSGRLVSRPVDALLSAGLHRCTVEGLPSGVYLYRLRAQGEELTRRLVVTR
jgi:hypothetical protein